MEGFYVKLKDALMWNAGGRGFFALSGCISIWRLQLGFLFFSIKEGCSPIAKTTSHHLGFLTPERFSPFVLMQ